MRHVAACPGKVGVFAGMILLLLLSCERFPEPIVYQPGADYFPLRTGAYSIYQVDSTHVQLNVETDFIFQLRLMVVDSFLNGEGSFTYVIQRDKRDLPTDPWTSAGTFSARTNQRQAVVVEGNTSFIRLQFPIAKGNRWDGNALNSFGGDETCDGVSCDRYEVSDLGLSYTLFSGTVIEPVVRVIQSNDEDVLVKHDIRNEMYAKDIGLVYKDVTVLEYCTQGICFGKQFVDKGIRYKQALVEYGTN